MTVSLVQTNQELQQEFVRARAVLERADEHAARLGDYSTLEGHAIAAEFRTVVGLDYQLQGDEMQVENVAAGAFGRVVCQPLAGIDRNRQLLIIMSQSNLPPKPAAEAQIPATTARRKLPDMAPVPPLPLAPVPE